MKSLNHLYAQSIIVSLALLSGRIFILHSEWKIQEPRIISIVISDAPMRQVVESPINQTRSDSTANVYHDGARATPSYPRHISYVSIVYIYNAAFAHSHCGCMLKGQVVAITWIAGCISLYLQHCRKRSGMEQTRQDSWDAGVTSASLVRFPHILIGIMYARVDAGLHCSINCNFGCITLRLACTINLDFRTLQTRTPDDFPVTDVITSYLSYQWNIWRN